LGQPSRKSPGDAIPNYKCDKALAAVQRFLRASNGFLRLSQGAAPRRPIAGLSQAGIPDSTNSQHEHSERPASVATADSPSATLRDLEPRLDHRAATASALEILKNVVRPIWAARLLTWAFAEGKVAEKVQEEAGAGWPILPTTAAAFVGTTEVQQIDLLDSVRAWIEMAEDLITLQLLRRLSQFLAQIWVIAGVA
jgi:hypothetical protein